MSKKVINIMEKCEPFFEILKDPERRKIILTLSENGPMTVTEITSNSNLSRPAISHHLKLLKNVGLINLEKQGTSNFYYASLDKAIAYLKDAVVELEKCNKKNKLKITKYMEEKI